MYVETKLLANLDAPGVTFVFSGDGCSFSRPSPYSDDVLLATPGSFSLSLFSYPSLLSRLSFSHRRAATPNIPTSRLRTRSSSLPSVRFLFTFHCVFHSTISRRPISHGRTCFATPESRLIDFSPMRGRVSRNSRSENK